MINLSANWNAGAYVAMSILSIIGITFLTYLLFVSYKKERVNYKNELANFIEGVQSKSEISNSVQTYINRLPKDNVFSLIYFDLDKSQSILNAFGSIETKKLIEKLSKKIISILPMQVQIGRVGNDQFVVFLRSDYTRNEAISLSNKIKKAINEPINIYNDTVINPSVSVSVAFYPIDGDTFKKLLDSLKIAVYVAKRDGGNKVIVASNELSQKENENVNYYTQLKNALKNDEFVLYYQPIVNIEAGEVVSLEGLLRWNHPEFGVLSPFKFINVLEQSGDINWVGVWGIEILCKEYFELKRLYPFKEFNLSINLSTRQLLNESVAVEFQKVLKKYRMNASTLVIEIEEFIIFDQNEIIKKNIKQLKELGFKIAVDSFAIDQSVLNKIKDMPIDYIKIDCDFVKDNQDAIKDRYIELIVEFAKERNIEIIAEGIEDYEMFAQLKRYGITFAEGYYFGKPMPEADLHKFIGNESLITTLINKKEDQVMVFDPADDDEPADYEGVTPLSDEELEQSSEDEETA